MDKQEILDRMKQVANEKVATIKNIIIENKEVTPEIILGIDNPTEGFHTRIIPQGELFFRDNHAKDKLVPFLQELIRRIPTIKEFGGDNIIAVLIVSDIYWAKRDLNGKSPEEAERLKNLPPSEDPNRLEAIMINCQMKGDGFMDIYPYQRIGTDIKFEEPEQMPADMMEGRFAKIFAD